MVNTLRGGDMVRNLYRFYLYVVYIVLLIFIAGALGALLAMLLAFTPLRGSYGNIPDRAQVVQSISLATVAVVIAGALASFHYWLIRRDMRSDPEAGTSGIRAFFLNMTVGIGVSVVVPVIGFEVISSLAQSTGANVVGAAAFAIPTLALVILLDMERRRTRVDAGAALVFQRLHLYGLQIILLISLISAWSFQFRSIIDAVFFGGRACGEASGCPSYNPVGLGISLLWFAVFWLGYGWMVKDDSASPLRLILHYLQFAVGVGFLLSGLYLGVEVILLPFFHQGVTLNDVVGPYSGLYDFVSPLTLGIIVVSVYHVWLRMAARRGLIERRVLFLTECTIIAVLAAFTFWWGYGNLLYNIFQILTRASNLPDARMWVSAIASVVVGTSYIGLDIYLWRRDVAEPSLAVGPRRGLVFALLGGGTLAFAIGGALALYAWATALFGSPLDNGQQMINAGLAAFIVGVFLLGIYLWVARREHLFSSLGKKPTAEPLASVAPPLSEQASSEASPEATVSPASPSETSPVPAVTIEEILDDLLAEKITRDEAAMRIRALEHS
jgi:Domain of unknown function (DUF5671)